MCAAVALAAALTNLAGCSQAPRRVAIPPASDRNAYQPIPYNRPLPPDATGYQRGIETRHVPLPGERAFVQAYHRARDPRLMVLVHADTRRHAYDRIGAGPGDYHAIAISMIDYLNANGQVDIRDAKMLKQRLSREKFLAVENGDSSALPLLRHELQTDVLVNISATPTSQSSAGTAVRLTEEALSTTDGRILAADYVDMPLPMSKTNINMYTRFLAAKLMSKLANVWGGGGGRAYHPIEVRIYHVRNVDSVLRIRRFIERVRGVHTVITRGITGGRGAGYGVLDVRYSGSPTAFYYALKREMRGTHGLSATDIQGNTIDLQATRRMRLRAARRPSSEMGRDPVRIRPGRTPG